MSMIEFQGGLQAPEMSTAGTVPTGKGWWIVGTDGKPYFKSDGQVLTDLTTGGAAADVPFATTYKWSINA